MRQALTPLFNTAVQRNKLLQTGPITPANNTHTKHINFVISPSVLHTTDF